MLSRNPSGQQFLQIRPRESKSLERTFIVNCLNSEKNMTMKALIMLLTCPHTRSEVFSIELFRRTEQFQICCHHCSLWASVKSLATSNINVYQVVAEWKETFVEILLCNIPNFWVFWCLTSCYYCNIFLDHVGEMLIFTQSGHRHVVHPNISLALPRK